MDNFLLFRIKDKRQHLSVGYRLLHAMWILIVAREKLIKNLSYTNITTPQKVFDSQNILSTSKKFQKKTSNSPKYLSIPQKIFQLTKKISQFPKESSTPKKIFQLPTRSRIEFLEWFTSPNCCSNNVPLCMNLDRWNIYVRFAYASFDCCTNIYVFLRMNIFSL